MNLKRGKKSLKNLHFSEEINLRPRTVYFKECLSISVSHFISFITTNPLADERPHKYIKRLYFYSEHYDHIENYARNNQQTGKRADI